MIILRQKQYTDDNHADFILKLHKKQSDKKRKREENVLNDDPVENKKYINRHTLIGGAIGTGLGAGATSLIAKNYPIGKKKKITTLILPITALSAAAGLVEGRSQAKNDLSYNRDYYDENPKEKKLELDAIKVANGKMSESKFKKLYKKDRNLTSDY